ncbi:MAG: hypothetical protein NVS4B10_02030 [Myxococcales bacterium]
MDGRPAAHATPSSRTLEPTVKMTLQLALALSLLAAPAFAKKSNAKNHHCMMKDGSEAAGKTKKACKKAGGKWVRNGAAMGGSGMSGTTGAMPPADTTTGTTTPPPEPAK